MNKRLLVFLSSLLAMQLQSIPMIFAAESPWTAPDCALTSIDGNQKIALQQFRGKVVYVDFWASWCPPCLKSFPVLNGLEHDFKDRGLQILAVNLDEELKDAKEFLVKYPADFLVVLDASKQCAQSFKVQAMPTSYLVDRKGVVRHTSLGFRVESAKQLREQIEQLLKEDGGLTK